MSHQRSQTYSNLGYPTPHVVFLFLFETVGIDLFSVFFFSVFLIYFMYRKVQYIILFEDVRPQSYFLVEDVAVDA